MWEMECSDPIMEEVFLFNSHIAYLYLFHHQVVINSEGRPIALPLNLRLTYDMERNERGEIVGLIIMDGDMQYQLKKSQWPDADKWEATLMRYIPHANFHSYF